MGLVASLCGLKKPTELYTLKGQRVGKLYFPISVVLKRISEDLVSIQNNQTVKESVGNWFSNHE